MRRHRRQLLLISYALCCGVFLWIAATGDDWVAGLIAGVYLSLMIVQLP